MSPQLALALVALPAAGCFYDRWIGSGDLWPGSARDGRHFAVPLSLLAFGLCAVVMGLHTVNWPWTVDTTATRIARDIAVPVIFALCFGLWRVGFGWRIAPTRAQLPGTFIRHAVSAVYALPAAMAGLSALWVAFWMLVFAAIATELAWYNTQTYVSDSDNQHAKVEKLRGLAHGACLAIGFGGAIMLKLGVTWPV